MIHVASYCRVSTDKDDQSNSFEAQQRYFKEYIDRQPDWNLYDVYADMKIAKMIQRAGIEYRENRRKYRLLAHLLLPGAFIFLRLNTA